MGEWCDNVDWHDWHRDDNDDAYHNVKVPRNKFEPNPLHYHTYYKFKSLLMESKKARKHTDLNCIKVVVLFGYQSLCAATCLLQSVEK